MMMMMMTTTTMMMMMMMMTNIAQITPRLSNTPAFAIHVFNNIVWLPEPLKLPSYISWIRTGIISPLCILADKLYLKQTFFQLSSLGILVEENSHNILLSPDSWVDKCPAF